MPLDFVGDQLKDSYGGVLHIQNENDTDNDNTGFDPLRPDDLYKVYDGNGRQIPIAFQGDSVIVSQLTVLSPVVVDTLPKRYTVNYVAQDVPANGSALYLINFTYCSMSIQSMSSDVQCIVRVYPSEYLSSLDDRTAIAELIELPSPNCGLINQISTALDPTVYISAQTVGMTIDNSTADFACIVSNLTGTVADITLQFAILAFEAITPSSPG